MAAQVPGFVWPIVFGADVILVVSLVVALRRHGGSRSLGVAAGAGILLAAWLVLATILAGAGAFVAGPGRAPTIGLAVLAPILAGGLALASSRTVRARVLAIPQPWLVGIQSLRVLGIAFLVLLSRGVLPAQFALPAGWGDVAVGAAAPFVAWALSRKMRWAPTLAVVWNAFGILDLVVAVGMGTLSTDSSVRVFMNAPSAGPMAQLPLALIPTFGVPIFVLLHVASLFGLRSRARAVRPHDAGVAEYA